MLLILPLFLPVLATGGCAAGSEGSIDATSEPPREPDEVVGDRGGTGEDDGEGGEGEPECSVDLECGDQIACTIDHCVDGRCVHEPCRDCCEDGLTCIPGYGCGRAPLPCSSDEECGDSVRCTLDRCRDATFCENIPQNELCAEGEICLAALGCIPRPPDSCEDDADCTPPSPCLGHWYCDPDFGCQFLSPINCDDGDDCTDDRCDEEAGGCINEARDSDGDGHGDARCGGDDCDDGNPGRYPGAAEECDATDNDCDGIVDDGCCTEGSPCTTPCGTSGRQACNPDGTSGPCVPPDEFCNGIDDDCSGTPDDGFECSPPGGTESCTTPCSSTGRRVCLANCRWGSCDPPEEECNGVDDDCDGLADEGFACRAGSVSVCPTVCGSEGTRWCLRSCTWDLCTPPEERCNGVDDDCDGTCDDGFTCCMGQTRDCTAFGYWGGTAVCLAGCGEWDMRGCTNCGNGRIDAGEECDGADLGGNDCTTIGRGLTGGVLRCAAGCRFDTSGCTRCGNGVREGTEQCDGSDLGGNNCTTIGMGFSGGTLRCSPSCTFDTSACTSFDPSGSYTITPPPSYMCAFGLVDFTIRTLTFTDNGTMLFVYGAPCPVPNPMIGPSARTSRSINVSCTYPGTCNETYSLTGSFTDDNRWTGTFNATYSGICFDCFNQSWSVTGQR